MQERILNSNSRDLCCPKLAKIQTHAPGMQQELIDWFTATTGHPLSQSQVSKILGLYYDYLDGAHTKKNIQKIKGKLWRGLARS